jgi:cytidine deaminase
MPTVSSAELIAKATAVIRRREHGSYTVGDVGCALESGSGNIYLGVCIDTPSGMGFCAEHNAIGTMVTAGETTIRRIVAVWEGEGETYVVSPCGRCREFMFRIDERNLETEIILGDGEAVSLRTLLPRHAHYSKTEQRKHP